MNKTFADNETAAVFAGKRVTRWGPELTRKAQRKLAMLTRAGALDDLRVSPRESLAREFLEPMRVTPSRLAKTIGVSQRRIGEILAGRRAITADTGLRLSRVCGLRDGFWVGLQADDDAAKASQAMGSVLERIQPFQQPFDPQR